MLKIINRVGVVSAPEGSAKLYSKNSNELIDSNRETDDLDALINDLSNNDPGFAALLDETSKALAPLALSDDGEVTVTSLRMSAGLTQKALAEKIGQKQSNISLIESGQRDNIQRETMRLMCAAFNCDMNMLDLAIENSKTMLLNHHDKQEGRRCEITDDMSRGSA